MKKNFKLLGIIVLAMIIGLSMTSCGEECLHENVGTDWESDGDSFVKKCSDCNEVMETYEWTRANFRGNWAEVVTSGTAQTVAITNQSFTLTPASGSYVFSITSWVPKTNAYTGSKDTHPLGFAFTGNVTTNNTGTITATSVEVYLNNAGDELTLVWPGQSSQTVRKYAK